MHVRVAVQDAAADVRFDDLEKRGDGKAQVGCVVPRGGRLTLVTAANRDQRHPQPVRVIVVLQASNFVVRDELEVVEVFRKRQGHARTAASIGGVDDGILAKFRDIGDAWVFNTP